jgi:putative PIN family toxin of toxin-antitoxin system
MIVVADTNTIVSGMLWGGKPREVLDLGGSGRIALYTSPALLSELASVLARAKFQARIQGHGRSVAEVVEAFSAVVTLIQPGAIAPVIRADPDDDAVLACALGARAEVIVSGDHHLLDLGSYDGIPILTASEFLERLAKLGGPVDTGET